MRARDGSELPPEDSLFARALDKPLSAEVFLRSILGFP